MQLDSHRLARRDVLRATGGALAATGASGLAAAAPDEQVRVNVGFDAEVGKQATLSEADAVVRDFNSLDAVTAKMTRKAADELAARPDVRYVEEDGRMHALAQTLPWGIDRVDADEAHDDGFTGDGADLAIIDTGIDSDHPDLQANIGAGEAFVTCSGSGCNEPWDDDYGHGTHCAGIADAIDNSIGVVGVSTEATLHSVKVLDSFGGGSFSDVAAGIEHVADEGWDVGSMSLGGGPSQVVEDAVQYADNNGVFLVAAAGNDYGGPVSHPAAYPEVMAVSSTDDQDNLSNFSNVGPEIEIAAPGTDVYSTIPGGYDTYSGTSMACPHVGGAAAMLMANGFDNAGARTRLQNTAEDIGLPPDEQGSGLLDVEAAVDGLGDNPPVVDDFDIKYTVVNGRIKVKVGWRVSDQDGDLSAVKITLDRGKTPVDGVKHPVSGGSASGTDVLQARKRRGTYVVTIIVVDDDGNASRKRRKFTI